MTEQLVFQSWQYLLVGLVVPLQTAVVLEGEEEAEREVAVAGEVAEEVDAVAAAAIAVLAVAWK